MKLNLRKSILVLVVAALVFAALPITNAQDMTIESVCLVTDVGRVNDGTFNQYAYEGMIQAGEEFDLETNFIETTAATDYAANIGTCVDEDFDVIVTVGFFLQDATLVAAQENPEVYFIGVDQAVADGPTNYVGTQFREDQAGFLVGVLAALVTESNIVAGVYGIDIPPVVKFRNGFEQGILYAEENLLEDKDVEALGVYIPDFVAPDRGASAAEQFIGEGADVIFGAGGPTGSGGISAAAQQEVWVIGVDQDEYLTTFGGGETPGAEFIISSATKRVDVAVYSMIEALVNGDMETFIGGGTYVFSAEVDGVGFAPKHDAEIPDEYYDELTTVLEGLKSGEIETGVDPESGVLLGAEEAAPEATEEP
jgi:basic membrane lipoprotein Med (substrate-binding protein (PBP1-ABC) superfamily)